MPTFEFWCEECGVLFEELFLTREETEEHSSSYPCKQCGKGAVRVPISKVNFQFKGTPGSSGSHDLDYPTADKAVGRSAAKKWAKYHEEQAARDKVRRETGQKALASMADGSAAPVDQATLQTRDVGSRKLKEARDAMKKGKASVVDPAVVRDAMKK